MTIGFQPFCVRILETLIFEYQTTCDIWCMPKADSDIGKLILENLIIEFQPFCVRILETSTIGVSNDMRDIHAKRPIVELKN